MPRNKYKYHDWAEYFRGHNVLNCNAVHQQSGPCQKVNGREKWACDDECKNVSARAAMKKEWLKKISNDYNHYNKR